MGIREDKQINKEIAAKIKAAREAKGFTQAQVAKLAKLDSNSYAKIERGISRPFGITITKIAKALGVKSSDILPV